MFVEWGGDSWAGTDLFMTNRTNGVATYRNTDFFGMVEGLNFALQYQGKMKAITAQLMVTVMVYLQLIPLMVSHLLVRMQTLTVLMLKLGTVTANMLKFGLYLRSTTPIMSTPL